MMASQAANSKEGELGSRSSHGTSSIREDWQMRTSQAWTGKEGGLGSRLGCSLVYPWVKS